MEVHEHEQRSYQEDVWENERRGHAGDTKEIKCPDCGGTKKVVFWGVLYADCPACFELDSTYDNAYSWARAAWMSIGR